ncbi:riboflavin synthase [bacterium]|nr:riboflavin synthase [bacterium]
MFTGLVKEIGTVKGLRRRGDIAQLTLRAPRCAGELDLGDSLAVNGVCLTVTGLGSGTVTVDAVAETLRVTTLGGWRSGRRVHLEPALRAGDSLGGHLVLGHVDGVGVVAAVRRRGEQMRLAITYPAQLGIWLLPKGSIAVDGVSLTLDERPSAGVFTVNLIPHTLRGTRFAELRPGERVNLEADVLAKGAGRAFPRTAAQAPAGRPAPLTLDRVLRSG